MDKLAKSRPSRRAERRSVVWIWKWQLVFPLVEGIRGVFHMKSDRNSRSQVPDPDSFLILTTNWPNMGWSGCESQIVDFGKLQYYCRTQSPPPPPSLSLPLPRFQHWKGVRQALLQNKLKPPTSTSHRLYVFSCFSCIFITFYPPQGHPTVSNSEVTVQVTRGSSIKSNGCSGWIDRTSNSKSRWHMLLNWDCEIETCQSTEWVVFSLASQSVS